MILQHRGILSEIMTFFSLPKIKNNARKWRQGQNKNVTHSLSYWNSESWHGIEEKSKMTVFQPVAEEVFLLKIFAEEQAENGITYVVVFNAAATFLHFISSYEKSRFQNSSQPRRGTWITRPIFGR